jgi:cation diffusion facilitator family transporter
LLLLLATHLFWNPEDTTQEPPPLLLLCGSNHRTKAGYFFFHRNAYPEKERDPSLPRMNTLVHPPQPPYSVHYGGVDKDTVSQEADSYQHPQQHRPIERLAAHNSDHLESNSVSSHFVGSTSGDDDEDDEAFAVCCCCQRTARTSTSTSAAPMAQAQQCGSRWCRCPRSVCRLRRCPTVRQLALSLSLYFNIFITLWKLVAYLQTYSLSVLAALLDSVLDVVSQVVLNYTEQHSSLQRSSAFYPAGASRLEPIGVLTCAALMGMASFEVLKESLTQLASPSHENVLQPQLSSVAGMVLVVVIKLALLWLCRRGALKREVRTTTTARSSSSRTMEMEHDHAVPTNGENAHGSHMNITVAMTTTTTASCSWQSEDGRAFDDYDETEAAVVLSDDETSRLVPLPRSTKPHVPRQETTVTEWQMADPTLEALAQDHWNDCLSNGVAALALVLTAHDRKLWFLDPIGAIVISLYIIYSWFTMGKEQIEHLTGKSAPEEFIEELVNLANGFDERITVDTVRAYHFGPKFLVEIEIVMDASTLLFESHDVGMELQYEIEGREEVERCFVHIDYQTRPYDEHVVSKVPELRDKYTKQPSYRSTRSV